MNMITIEQALRIAIDARMRTKDKRIWTGNQLFYIR